jgi:uncharacterized protein
MTRDELLARLRDHKPWLAEQGIVNLRLFGSYARDEAGPDSDVDLLVDTSRPLGLEFLTVERLLGERLGRSVEFCSADVMHPRIRIKAEGEAVAV